jgi:sugar (pentulose or hexulose) kinase
MQRDAWSTGGVAMDTFAYSLLGVNADQRAPTPCFTYADSGCTARVAELRRQLGRADDATAHRMPALTRAI